MLFPKNHSTNQNCFLDVFLTTLDQYRVGTMYLCLEIGPNIKVLLRCDRFYNFHHAMIDWSKKSIHVNCYPFRFGNMASMAIWNLKKKIPKWCIVEPKLTSVGSLDFAKFWGVTKTTILEEKVVSVTTQYVANFGPILRPKIKNGHISGPAGPISKIFEI